MDTPPIIDSPNRLQLAIRSFTSPEAKLYCSYFLSSWGDRMWAFSLGLALGVISGDLQYTAASGLVNSSARVLFASVVGRWVDRTARLKAARTALIINNFTVASSAALLVIVLFFPHKIGSLWNGAMTVAMIAASIILCAVSVLANCATKICITKDWVVVIAGPDKDRLADINSMMVRIDMASMVFSPLLAGQIMSSFGIGWGCAFIGCWNVGSFFMEYFMQMMVYKSCPGLAVRGRPNEDGHIGNDDEEGTALASAPIPNGQPITGIVNGRKRICSPFRAAITSTVGGYSAYFHQVVFPAGLSLAFLYLTVLGFDGITTVYMLSLGLAENWIALCNGVGAVMGFLGGFAYPILRHKLELPRTGLVSMTMQWICLLLPVVSIWLPGSNFDLSVLYGNGNGVNSTTLDVRAMEESLEFGAFSNTSNNTETTTPYISRCSSMAFIAGVVLSRMGLWMADLTISQVFQENVAEHERGVVNGVQDSLNSIMDIAKGILVIILPDPRTFGLLIIISWFAVFIGFLFFCYYAWTQRRNVTTSDSEMERSSEVNTPDTGHYENHGH